MRYNIYRYSHSMGNRPTENFHIPNENRYDFQLQNIEIKMP